jgi:three-Cys-motif partner protein
VGFFEEKKSAAVLKHALIRRYLPPFVMKTGKLSVQNRVAFVDGFAGEGRYEDGQEGSPAIAMRVANQPLIAANRTLECVFVEENAETYARLQAVIAAESGQCKVEARYGTLHDHLGDILTEVNGIPTLVFLDPFGLTVTFDEVVQIFGRPAGLGVPATEVLINFSSVGLRRFAGLLTSPNPGKGAPKTLARLDAVCGGDWWRETWLAHGDDKDAAEEAVVAEYAARLSAKAGTGYWIVDVKQREGTKPVYYLVFLTRHRDGLEVFGEAVSKALEEWRKRAAEALYAGTLMNAEDEFKMSVAKLADEWVDEIYKNLKRLLAAGKAFTVLNRYSEVYGTATGLARETHLRKAWRRAFDEGLTSTDSRGDLIQKRIVPA